MLTYEIEEKKYYFNHGNDNNIVYISSCAALSFHKCIIGLSELMALESVKDIESAGGLRISRAVTTYYTIYHLFVALMLIDKKYKIQIPKRLCKNGVVELGVNCEDLSDPSELPEVWKKFGELEQDVSTLITHSSIKEYCDYLRRNTENIGEVHKILFDYFIYVDQSRPNESIIGLYEKICYIRDRAIYRPSNVIDKKGLTIQTSKDVRKEIESLPDSAYLFDVIKEIYKKIIKTADVSEKSIIKSFYSLLWTSNILVDEEDATSLGYDKASLEELKFMRNVNKEELSFSTYITHLMELVDQERAKNDVRSLWNELIAISMEFHEATEWHY